MPRARIKLFTTPKDSAGQALHPVYRFSYADGSIVRHVYAVGPVDRANISPAWKLDGIEGYMYPPTIPQPSGTSAIYRWVKASASSYMLVPNGDQAVWTARGFQSDGTGVLGYAFLHDAIFNDVRYGHYAKAEVDAMYHNQITTRCSSNPPHPPPVYCPLENVTRAQMAVFIGRRLHVPGWGPPNITSIFPDVSNGPNPPQHPFRDWIMQTYNDGIMGQCPTSPGNFCPDIPITREEMAQVLLRAKYGRYHAPPPPGTQIFSDVPTTSPWAPWIHQIYQEQITLGCLTNPLRYCPTNPVNREAMALFFSRAFQLLL